MFIAHKELLIQNSTRQLHLTSAREGSQVNSYFLLHAQHPYCWEEAALRNVHLSHSHSLAIPREENLPTCKEMLGYMLRHKELYTVQNDTV